MSGLSYLKLDSINYPDNKCKTIQEFLQYKRDNSGDKEAYVLVNANGTRKAITWNTLWEKSHQVACSFIRMGVQKGEYVALYMKNCPEWIYIAFGTILSGACLFAVQFVDKNWDNIVYLLNKLKKCGVFICEGVQDGQKWDGLSDLLTIQDSFDGRVKCAKIPYLRYVVGIDDAKDKVHLRGIKTVEELFRGDIEDLPESHEEDTIVCFQSSGSTGPPKIRSADHKNILKYSSMHGEETKVFIGLFFSDGCKVTRSLVSGPCLVFIDGMSSPYETIDTESLIKMICNERCISLSSMAKENIYDLIKRKDSLPNNWPVIHISDVGEPLNRNIADAIGKVWLGVTHVYASVEVGGSQVTYTDPDQYKEFYCGKVYPTFSQKEVKIVDECGCIVPKGHKGEIYIRSDEFKGYLNDPQKTNAVMMADGWFKTDDIGMMNENDGLYVYGRKSNIINAEEVSISPELLEEALEKYPGVAKVVVVPKRDDVYHFVLCACVYLNEGVVVTEEQLRNHCDSLREETPSDFQVLPRYYVFLDKFPVNSAGKSPRKELTSLAEKVFTNNGN